MNNERGRPYKEINDFFWKAVSIESQNPQEAKKMYELIEDLENNYRHKKGVK
jgi:hypothetical protein